MNLFQTANIMSNWFIENYLQANPSEVAVYDNKNGYVFLVIIIYAMPTLNSCILFYTHTRGPAQDVCENKHICIQTYTHIITNEYKCTCTL